MTPRSNGRIRSARSSRSLVGIMVLICSLVGLLGACGGSSGEDAKRRALVVSLKAAVEKHHQQTGMYPSLETVSLPDKDLLISYLQSGVVQYYRDPSAKAFFVIRCIFSGDFKSQDGKYSISWNGMQFSNKKDQLLGFQDAWEPDRDGFYIWDLH